MKQRLRIRQMRSKRWRLPAGGVSVGAPGPWANPFETADSFRLWFEAGKVSEDLLPDQTDLNKLAERRAWMRENLRSLRGHVLACWCRVGAECHGDVLVWLASQEGQQ